MIGDWMPLSLQLASFFFFLAALWGDLLLIRGCLTMAYGFLVLGVVIAYLRDNVVLVDAGAWAVTTGALHGLAAFRLGREARANAAPVAGGAQGGGGGARDDDERLERFLSRRTGAARTDVARLRRAGGWTRHGAGSVIVDTAGSRERLYLIVEGRVRIEWRDEGDAEGGRTAMLASGDAFDLRILNLAGVFVGFPNEAFRATAATDATCFAVGTSDLRSLVGSHGHFTDFLRVLALDQLARALSRATAGTAPVARDAYGRPEDAAWGGGGRSRDFDAPLDAFEIERARRPSTLAWLWSALAPTPGPGGRNAFSPLSGSLASAHVGTRATSGLLTAKHDASARLLASLEVEAPGGGTPCCVSRAV